MKSVLLATLTLLAATAVFALEGHDQAAAGVTANSAAGYPLTTCVVSGDKLGVDGDPVKYIYKQAGKPDRLVEFCCEDCIKDFEKDPAKYLARLDAARAAPTALALAAPAKNDGSADAACCADDQACCEIVKAYLPVADALAADDLGKAQASAATLAKQADADGMKAIYDPALALVHAADLKAARTAFKVLSAEVEPLVAGNKDYVVMHCPMARADWVQTDAKVRNPYYGKMMLTCGAPKETVAR
jgi:hypothetical protein